MYYIRHNTTAATSTSQENYGCFVASVHRDISFAWEFEGIIESLVHALTLNSANSRACACLGLNPGLHRAVSRPFCHESLGGVRTWVLVGFPSRTAYVCLHWELRPKLKASMAQSPNNYNSYANFQQQGFSCTLGHPGTPGFLGIAHNS
jgi:hypothetical protein